MSSIKTRLVECLAQNQIAIVAVLAQKFQSMAFENRYTLHPRRLKELGSEEYACLEAYLTDGDVDAVDQAGRQRAREGLGERLILAMGDSLREFCFNGNGLDVELMETAVMEIDRYMNAYLAGYMQELEALTLKDQEQLRQALSAALEQQRRELHIKNHAIHTSIDGIMITDLEGKITYANPAFVKMWGYASEAEVKSLRSARFFGADTEEDVVQMLAESGGWQVERSSRCKDGTVFEVAISASLIADDAGSPVGVMASMVDITERKRLEAQFRQAQKMEALGQLAGGIVHDFNNLLTAIGGYAELELMDLPKQSQQYQDFQQIKIATDRGADLTNQLRVFTSQASGKQRIVDVNKTIDETSRLLKRTFPPEVDMQTELDAELWQIEADTSQISQLLMNICVNARDALVSGQNHAQGTIRIETRNVRLERQRSSRFFTADPGEYVAITISDTGAGMSSEVMERLFEPFYTTKGAKRGTGLGLAVVYGIAQQHNAFIDVGSEVGNGSMFEILIPAVSRVSEEASPAAEVVLATGKGLILLVDDETQVRTMAARALESCGYTVLQAANGLQGLAVYEEQQCDIDLVVLDMLMPEMGGWECFRRVIKVNPEARVLIITGYTADRSAQDFLKEGAIGVIEKPFSLHAFTEAVQSHVKG